MEIRLPDDIRKIAEVGADSEGLTIEQWVAGLVIEARPTNRHSPVRPMTLSEMPVGSRYPVGYED